MWTFVCKSSSASTNSDEYKDKAVELIGWGAKVRSGVASVNLKRITIKVFSKRYIFIFKPMYGNIIFYSNCISNFIN
jgi:hypothetical protein